MHVLFNTEGQRDQVIQALGADKRGREPLARLAAYVESRQRR